MDAQMKRGFLEICVLSSLQGRDSYGYQILKEVPDRLLRGAHRTTAKVLPTHADRRGTHRRVPIRAGGHYVDL